VKGAVQQYQSQLIDAINREIDALEKKFTQ
jgi:hypothetical protein